MFRVVAVFGSLFEERPQNEVQIRTSSKTANNSNGGSEGTGSLALTNRSNGNATIFANSIAVGDF
jgi:hypothetical protein